MDGARFRQVSHLLRPRSITIVGASERSAWAKIIFSNLKMFGFPGSISLVNPNYARLWDTPCYPDLAALPEMADHALIIVPASAVVPILQNGANRGLKAATVYAANVGEGSNSEAVRRGAALRDLCSDTGLVLAGPNCMGAMSFRERAFCYPNFPTSELCTTPAGGVAAVFQSGGTLQIWAKAAADRGLRFSYLVSSGNELNLDLADYIDFLVADENTKVIVLFVEGIRRPQAFMAAAARALAAGKPVIAFKTGKSSRSREAAQSHTGAIAGDYQVFEAMCRRYGILVCDSLDETLELVLAFQPGRLPKGPRLGVFTTSGGTVDMLHDYLEEVGELTTPAFEAATQARIRELVPPETRILNPLDAGNPAGDRNAAAICQAIADDANVDMLAWAGQLPVKPQQRDAAVLRAVFEATDKPVISFSRMHHLVDETSLGFQEQSGIPFLQDPESALRAFSALARYASRVGAKINPLPKPAGRDRAALVGEALSATLARHRLTSPQSALVETPQQAAQAASRIGFPVALKIVSQHFSHKTEVGGVRLDLKSASEIEREAAAMVRSLREIDPAADIGFLVQEMVRGVEVILGARTDPLYGPVLLVGAGGILVELVKDVSFCLLPVEPSDAARMIDGLRLSKLLNGFRNSPRCDIDALVAAVCGLSDLYLDYRDVIADIEINPLMVMPAGGGVRAADVRIVFK